MPQLSDTMDSGKILTWNKKEGDTISRGDILAEVETDKANLEIESFHEGTLLKIVTPADNSANVGEVIAYIGDPGESVGSSSSAAKSSSSPAPVSESPSTGNVSQDPAPRNGSSNGSSEYHTGKTSESTIKSEGRIKASPVAKKLAEQNNIDLASVRGSGPDGRIVKRDVESLGADVQAAQNLHTPAPQRGRPSSSNQPQQSSGSATAEGTLTPLSKMRDTIAKRMQQSVNEAPHFYTTVSIEMDSVISLRALLKERGIIEGVSLNHFIIKAAAYALAHEPRVNRAIRDGNQVFEPSSINIGVITALNDGLIIPVLHEVDKMSLSDVVFESRAMIERARAGRPTARDLSGGTFSISNMGMFDVESFTAIINPGQGAVIAISATKEQPIVKDGVIQVAQIMKATLSVDHRVIDGVMSGNFLKFFKEGLEYPALLMAS